MTPSTKVVPTISKSNSTDITVYGATSFTAKHVLSYLLRSSIHIFAPEKEDGKTRDSSSQSPPSPPVLKITLAGRNESKLNSLKYTLSETMRNLKQIHSNDEDDDSEGSTAPIGCAEFDVFIAEASQVDEIRAMAARCKIVLNCAGPFGKYGTEVVAACAEFGTDYVDITGEVYWASEMRRKYGKVAKVSGSRIISFCGFDSIPTDIAVFTAVEALRAKAGKNTQINRATTWVECHGFLNAGTVHTLIATPLRLSNWMQQIPFLAEDPLALLHPTRQDDPSMRSIRNRLALAEWKNLIPLFHSFLIGGASGAFPMALINAKVVHESALSLKYGDPETFEYYERHVPMGFPYSIQLKVLSMLAVIASQFIFWVSIAVLKLPFVGQKLADIFFPVGSGMSDDDCQLGFAELYTEVESPLGAAMQAAVGKDKVNKANCSLKFKGDPANWITAQCVCEAAFCLLLDKEKLPHRSEDGFGSPVELLGDNLLKRLTNTKIRPVECTINVRIATEKREWCMFN